MSQTGDMIKRRALPVIRRWILYLLYGFGLILDVSWMLRDSDSWEQIFVAFCLLSALIVVHRKL
jgi:hypothetical protein